MAGLIWSCLRHKWSKWRVNTFNTKDYQHAYICLLSWVGKYVCLQVDDLHVRDELLFFLVPINITNIHLRHSGASGKSSSDATCMWGLTSTPHKLFLIDQRTASTSTGVGLWAPGAFTLQICIQLTFRELSLTPSAGAELRGSRGILPHPFWFGYHQFSCHSILLVGKMA